MLLYTVKLVIFPRIIFEFKFHKGLKTQEINSGMLYEVWLRIAIMASVELGASTMHYDYV